jgi:hypothetical protein
MCIHNFGKKTQKEEALGRTRGKWEDNTEVDLKTKINSV